MGGEYIRFNTANQRRCSFSRLLYLFIKLFLFLPKNRFQSINEIKEAILLVYSSHYLDVFFLI